MRHIEVIRHPPLHATVKRVSDGEGASRLVRERYSEYRDGSDAVWETAALETWTRFHENIPPLLEAPSLFSPPASLRAFVGCLSRAVTETVMCLEEDGREGGRKAAGSEFGMGPRERGCSGGAWAID